MLGFLCSRTRSLKQLLNNGFRFCYSNNTLSSSQTLGPNIVYLPHLPPYAVNHFSTCQWFLKQTLENVENFNSSKMILKKDGTIKKRKKTTGVKVYIVNEKGISSSMCLEDAEKLARHQKMELKKVEEINGVAAYKLVTISDLLEPDIQHMNDKKKKEKIKKVIINVDINPHDLQTKITQLNKFLDKGMKVFIKLGDRNSESNKLNAIYDILEKSLVVHSVNKVVSKSGYLVNIVPKQKSTVTDEKKQ